MTKNTKHKKITSPPPPPPQESESNTKKKKWFGTDIKIHTLASPNVPDFDHDLREVMEPHLVKARKNREEKRTDIPGITDSKFTNCRTCTSVPYLALRNERSFSFDYETYPLHRILAEALGTHDLSLLHEESRIDKRKLMAPLLDRASRHAFHECYDNFITSFCIPYLHTLACKQHIFQNITSSASATTTDLTYRYQAFPCLRIVRPGEFSIGPHCDVVYGHSVGNINFHVPLTSVYGTNALYTESYPDKEDWHPLTAENVGIGYIFDGARCLHFSLENTTDTTRVSLDFRIAISLDDDCDDDDGQDAKGDATKDTLCTPTILKDRFEESGPGYYDNVIVRIGGGGTPESDISNDDSFVVKLEPEHRLLDPDKRVGFPFK